MNTYALCCVFGLAEITIQKCTYVGIESAVIKKLKTIIRFN